MHTLLVLNPGHFHAALVFRKSHPNVSDNVYVYSEGGEDLRRFQGMLESFNQRRDDPTQWHVTTYEGADPLEKLIHEKKGNAVVLAGKNDTRMQYIDALSGAGFSILADKPWITGVEALPLLKSALAKDRPLTLDIMTERYAATSILQKKIIAQKQIFGDVRVDGDGSPSVYMESVHHLYKVVNGRPLVRPPWYFDVNVQGDGIIDVSTHLVDMAHWMLFPDTPLRFEDDMELRDAGHWPTPVPFETFKKITLLDGFPDSLHPHVSGDTLDFFCNGDISYRVRGIPVHIRVVWNLAIPEGGGDTHYSYFKGTRSDLLVRQLPETGFQIELLIVPRGEPAKLEQTVAATLAELSETFPGISVEREDEKLLIQIPDDMRTDHEAHFCCVRDAFLEYLETRTLPPGTRECIMSKYTLLAEAGKMACGSPAGLLRAPAKQI